MTFTAQRLYDLLPAYDRVRDQESGRALEALTAVLARTLAALEEDLDQLYDDQFIETCADWVVPYLGDLIGYRPLRPTTAVAGGGRAEVANVIGRRRRKGTAAVLEQLARDVTQRDARVVEFFRLLATTQHLRHLRPELRTTDLRRGAALADAGGAFDVLPRSADVRRIEPGRGRHNIPDVGVFLWRLRAFPVTAIPATPAGGGQRRYRFSPLGDDVALRNAPEAENDVTHLAEPVNVPGPIRRRDLADHLGDYWDRAIAVRTAAGPVTAAQVRVCHLGDDPDDPQRWAHPPEPGTVAVDPELGRLAFPAATTGVRVTYHRAFPAALGGGEYDREATYDAVLRAASAPVVTVPGQAPSIAAAHASLAGADGVVEVTTPDPLPLTDLTLAAGQRVELRAHDGVRPLLTLAGDVTVGGGPDARLILNGFLVAGGALRVAGGVDGLTLRHCTLVPGRPVPGGASVLAEQAADGFALAVEQSITGPLRLPAAGASATLSGSVVDAGAGPRAWNTRLLMSGTLAPFPALSSAAPRLRVTIGADGPHDVTLAAVPTSTASAAELLQAAIRGAAAGPAFTRAVVTPVVTNRLAVLCGTGERVAVENSDDDPTAAELRLDPAAGRRTTALFGVALPPPVAMRSPAPAFRLRIGAAEAVVDGFGTAAAGLAARRTELQTRIRAAGGAGFATAVVGLVDGRMLVIPGAETESIAAAATEADATTVDDFGLALRPAVGGGPTGAEPGAVVRADRCTVIGPVFAREIPLAADSIFLDAVRALRRQVGCLRFCYLPIESQTPRRHRCVPSAAVDADRIQPVFTTLRYGLPGYAQLRPNVPAELAAGAADGGELGVYHDEQVFQRVADLRVRLDEHLRLGLEAGVMFAN